MLWASWLAKDLYGSFASQQAETPITINQTSLKRQGILQLIEMYQTVMVSQFI